MISVLDLFEENRIVLDKDNVFDFVAALIEYDYPRCFICKRNDDYFAFMECECNSEHISWTVSKTSVEELKEVYLGQSNIQSLFNGDLFEIYYNLENENGYEKVANPAHQIKGNFFSPAFGDMDELFDLHGLQTAAKTNKENSVSLVFEKNSNGSTSLIFKAINYLKSMFKCLNNPFDIMNTDLQIQNGSTVITFIAKNDINKEVNTTPDLKPLHTESFLEFGNILSSNNPDILLSYSKKPKQMLKKYKGVMSTLEKEEDLNPKIVLAISELETAKSYKISKKDSKTKNSVINKALSLVGQNTTINSRVIQRDGILSGIYSTKKGSFSFKSIFGEKYDGVVDIALLDKMNSFIVKGAIYNASIEEIISVIDKVPQKKNYVLKDLKFVKNIEIHEQLKILNGDN